MLIQAVYTDRMQDMIGRNIQRNTLERNILHAYNEHKKVVDRHKDLEKFQTRSKSFTITKVLDVLPDHLRGRMEVRGV